MPRKSSASKRELNGDSVVAENRPQKKVKLLDHTDDEGSDVETGTGFKVNEEYARRFEHNHKRAEQHRLEEKYGKGRAFQNEDEDSEDSEEGVEEDDNAELLNEALDDEVMATLNALRSKDPRIYNKDVKFYTEVEETGEGDDGAKKEASMTLRQFHTKNLLEGRIPGETEDDAPPRTYAQEQEEIRKSLVDAAADDGDDDFLVAKPKPVSSKKDRKKITQEDVLQAERDPELFLSNYMESRAWKPADKTKFQPLESDDDEEDAAIDEYEHAYNTYFEDTTGTNEKLTTYARDAVAATTVRRDEGNNRKKARDAARAKREEERKEREGDLARLRKLKVEEMEAKVQQIRKIGGLSGRDFKMDEWKDVLEAEWSDDQWDREMEKRFGESYYNEADAGSESDDAASSKKSKKPKKPKFDDDIDIKDLIPDFKDDDEDERPTLSSDDEEDEDAMDVDAQESATKPKSSKKLKQEKADAKAAARRDRRLIENLVNENLKYETALAAKPSKTPARFRYRETSPTTFGLTARDILLADDKQLNEFAGLKKLASFRDADKKKKDKKHLSKKARLRQWRQETFGDAEGPKGGFETLLGDEQPSAPVQHRKRRVEETESGIVEEEKKKKRRSRKKKSAEDEI
ncbi:ribosome biogenesis protein-like protein Kri1 [Boeremia exigua]|uniref:ribosome biogenesis protein-like protein Kri1 n=1 Tax=Boeremia exigua TaxID=749465 RepID=UPI001E8E8CF3|nr:ribosome biogenesis protein-like protein Kri1 [Boeremia exigua]KAH6642768.1 ribosome biogenesis protein-like protein Kri1 [Boeremia exigua]